MAQDKENNQKLWLTVTTAPESLLCSGLFKLSPTIEIWSDTHFSLLACHSETCSFLLLLVLFGSYKSLRLIRTFSRGFTGGLAGDSPEMVLSLSLICVHTYSPSLACQEIIPSSVFEGRCITISFAFSLSLLFCISHIAKYSHTHTYRRGHTHRQTHTHTHTHTDRHRHTHTLILQDLLPPRPLTLVAC